MIWWSILLVVILALNVVATFAAARSHYPTKRHLAFQVAAVWLLPILGAAAILVFVRSQSAYDPAGNFDPLYTPSDGGQPHEGWIPTASDFTGSSDGGSSD